MNKPKQNISTKNFFDIGRGGYQEIILETKALSSESNFNKIIRKIYKHRKWIVFSAIFGSVIYILFKNRKFVIRFLNRIKKFFKPVSKIYRKISNHSIISNRFTKSLLIFHRVVNLV